MSDYRSVPPPDPEEEFETVYRAMDATDGEITAQVLRDHGIGCRLLGTRNASLIGVGAQITPLRIEVARSRVAEARDLIAALKPPPSLDDEELPRPRRAVLAIGSTLLFFGGSHMYARRPWTAAVLAITQLSAILLLRSDQWPNRELGGSAMVAILMLDCVMGTRASFAENRGEHPAPLRQALAGVAWAAAAATLATLWTLHSAS